MSGLEGFAKFYWYGEDYGHRYLVMSVMGKSLDYYLDILKHFSLTTVLKTGKQLLKRIYNLHKHELIHRDLKPENLLTGDPDTPDTIYLIDFGLAKSFRDKKTGLHIPFRVNK
jgi:casein kinase 1